MKLQPGCQSGGGGGDFEILIFLIADMEVVNYLKYNNNMSHMLCTGYFL